jgi:hypothetical protein
LTGSPDELQELKAARKDRSEPPNVDYLEARKAEMLEAVAREGDEMTK